MDSEVASFVRRIGNDVDGMTDDTVTASAAFANYFKITESATIVPTPDEYFQHGFGRTGGQTPICSEIMAFLLYTPVPAGSLSTAEFGTVSYPGTFGAQIFS